MMYLKLDTDGKSIIGHDYKPTPEHTQEIENCVLVDENGLYDVEWTGTELKKLTATKKNNHPLNPGSAKYKKLFYREVRRKEYPPLEDFADAFVKLQGGDAVPMTEYVAACNAVKTKYPKE